ncbi:MAG: TonB-dependent receptor [Bacteroidetes bacterium]|nr:TonB-dependent receptor [Bacteroidota bacterium]
MLLGFDKTNAQTTIKGTVKDNANETLPGVSVTIVGITSGTATDIYGKFELNTTQSFPLTLLFSFVGFTTDSLLLHNYDGNEININLKKSVTLKAVDIKSKREATTISTINPINTTTIGQEELLKAACCNLSESFETNPTVDASFTDAVTGAKQIQILGLDGVYSQIQTELIPFIRGLSSNYGLAFIPGPFIESIQINKGVGSVVTGHESISGQVNIELKKPHEAEKFLINGYFNSEQRMELNTQIAGKLNKHVYTELLSHGSMLQNKVDHNKDGFLDSPLYEQINLYNRWQFIYNPVFEAQAGIRFVYDDKQGGQNQFSYANDYGTQNFYGIGIKNKMIDAFAKTGFLFKEKPWKSIGVIQSVRYHEQESYFGLKTFDGIQKSYYANAISQGIIGDTRHTFKNGVAFVYNDYSETFNQSEQNTIETTPRSFY